MSNTRFLPVKLNLWWEFNSFLFFASSIGLYLWNSPCTKLCIKNYVSSIHYTEDHIVACSMQYCFCKAPYSMRIIIESKCWEQKRTRNLKEIQKARKWKWIPVYWLLSLYFICNEIPIENNRSLKWMPSLNHSPILLSILCSFIDLHFWIQSTVFRIISIDSLTEMMFPKSI